MDDHIEFMTVINYVLFFSKSKLGELRSLFPYTGIEQIRMDQ